MRLLLTNDDGGTASGLLALRNSLHSRQLAITVIAPDVNRSGGSRAATFRGPVGIRELVSSSPHERMYECEGTPVDCVRVGLLSDLGADVALVVSGINEGANLGDDTTYSSTVGAGVEAALLGVPALCVSQQSSEGSFRLLDSTPHDFVVSREVAADFAEAMLLDPPPGRSVLNVNVPARVEDWSIEVTRLGHRYYHRGSLAPVSMAAKVGYFVFMTNEEGDPAYEDVPGTDFRAVREGRISATAIGHDWGDPHHASRLDEWVRRICDQVAATMVKRRRGLMSDRLADEHGRPRPQSVE